MIFKSYIIEESFEPIHNCKLFLFYGENQGLKQEFKEKLKKQNKTKEILNLFQDEIRSYLEYRFFLHNFHYF